MAAYTGPLSSGYAPSPEVDRRRQLAQLYQATQGRVPQLIAKPKGRVDTKRTRTWKDTAKDFVDSATAINARLAETLNDPVQRAEAIGGLTAGAAEKAIGLAGRVLDPIQYTVEQGLAGTPQADRNYGRIGKTGTATGNAIERGYGAMGFRPAPVARSLGGEVPQAMMSVDPFSAHDEALAAKQSWDQGSYLGAGGHGLMSALSMIPLLGGGMKVIKGGIKAAKEGEDLVRAARLAEALPDRAALEAATAAATGKAVAAAPSDVATTVGKRTAKQMVRAGEGQRGMMAVPSLREVDLGRAIDIARTEPHLIQGETGQFVGAPRGVRSRKQIDKMRNGLWEQLQRGIGGAKWYPIAREGNVRIAGPVPAKQSLLSQEQATWSAQEKPRENLNMALQAHNAYELGEPRELVRTSAQAEKYAKARDAGAPVPQGLKTGPYQQNLDPTIPHPTTGVNDIWHKRAFDDAAGYKGPAHDKALTAQEHAFLDYETVLLADRANKAKLGGRSDWQAHEIQAAIWVAGKGESLAKDWAISEAKKAANILLAKAKTPQARKEASAALKAAEKTQPSPEHLQRGYAEAAKSYPEFFDRHAANLTHEQTPSGSIPGFSNVRLHGTDAEKQAYEEAATWIDPATGRDNLVDAAGGYQLEATPATGLWQHQGGALQTNKAWASRPLVGIQPGGAGIDPASKKWLEGIETYRSFGDIQDASGGHMQIFHAAPGEMGSAVVPHQGPLSVEQMGRMQELGGRFGLPDPSDTGRGLTLTSFDPDNPPPSGTFTGEALTGLRRGRPSVFQGPPTASGQQPANLTEQIQTILPGAEPERASIDSVYVPMYGHLTPEDIAAGPSGKVTDAFLSELDKYTPEFRNRIEQDPRYVGKLQANIDRIAKYHQPTGMDERQWFDAINNALTILKEKGSAGLRAARESGVILPAAIAVVLGASQLTGPGQQQAGPQAY